MSINRVRLAELAGTLRPTSDCSKQAVDLRLAWSEANERARRAVKERRISLDLFENRIFRSHLFYDFLFELIAQELTKAERRNRRKRS